MLLHIKLKVHNGNIKMIFVVQFCSYPAFTVNIEVYVKVWNRPICICGVLYLKLIGLDVISKITTLTIIWWKDFIYIEEPDWLLFFLEKPLYEVCLVRIKEQVDKKRSTVCTHRYADCLLKSMFIKNNNYVLNHKLEHFDEISFRELFSRNQFFLQNKIFPFLRQSICIYVDRFL